MGADVAFLMLRFFLAFWALQVQRSSGDAAGGVFSPAPPSTYAVDSHQKLAVFSRPAPYAYHIQEQKISRLSSHATSSESLRYKHHHRHHRHHHHPHHGQKQYAKAAPGPYDQHAAGVASSRPPSSSSNQNLPTPAPPPVSWQIPIQPSTIPPVSSPAKSSPPSSIMTLPPPPPSQDCTTMTCTEPWTYTPSGFPCGCVWPIQVRMRLSIGLYTFFPLASEFAAEIASSLSLNLSQVRIMGSKAARQQPEKTVVLVNLVPFEPKFKFAAAFSAYQKFWRRQIHINSSLFGAYEVFDVHYPGLPPSPPAVASNLATIDDHPDPANYHNTNSNNKHNDDGTSLKPLGVKVPRRRKNRRDGRLLAVIIISSITACTICAAIAWMLIARWGSSAPPVKGPPTSVSSFTKPSVTAGVARSLALGSNSLSESLSFSSGAVAFTGYAKIFSLHDLEKATNNFDALRVLGEGGFGIVYRGTLDDGVEVAVKALKRDSRHGGREFLSEVEMLSRLHHRNLVKLIGICTEDNILCLVYELVPNGSVDSHLHGAGKEVAPLDWAIRMKIALGAARGLAYLHEDSSPCVIHRDFKSSNILLDNDFTPKVSDFGLATNALNEESQLISTHVIGTFGYLAPEYAMTGHLLVKSDVYSYGVVLLELLSGRKPVDFSKPPGQENLVAWAHPLLTSKEGLEILVDPTLEQSAVSDSFSKVAAIASMCVQPEVSRRPFMGEVVQALKLICSEFEEAKEEDCTESFIQERTSADEDHRNSCRISGDFQELCRTGYSVRDCESSFEARVALSATDLLGASAEFEEYDNHSLRRHSTSGPLATGRRKFWQRFRRLSRVSMKERLWLGAQ